MWSRALWCQWSKDKSSEFDFVPQQEVRRVASAGRLHERALGGYNSGKLQYSEIILYIEDMVYEDRPAQLLESCSSQVCKLSISIWVDLCPKQLHSSDVKKRNCGKKKKKWLLIRSETFTLSWKITWSFSGISPISKHVKTVALFLGNRSKPDVFFCCSSLST